MSYYAYLIAYGERITVASSDFYWSRKLIKGFGRMWFLLVPQEADDNGGGISLLGSVVKEKSGSIFGRSGLIGLDYPEPSHMTTPQLILNAISSRRDELGFNTDEEIVLTKEFPGLSQTFERKKSMSAGVENFPSIPATFSIDYSKMESITIEFGENTRLKYIPTGYLGRLKNSVNGDDRAITQDVNIDKEMIVHKILLTDQYSVRFNSMIEFDAGFDAKIEAANLANMGAVNFEVHETNRRQVAVDVNDGKEYLIALKSIDWDDF